MLASKNRIFSPVCGFFFTLWQERERERKIERKREGERETKREREEEIE